jgi:hypothetical protein
MSDRVIKLPDVGEGVAEAELVEWHVKVGDLVREDTLLGAVMTDKATVEIPSPAEGGDRACDRRRDLDRRLVGHHRRDRLILLHDIADRYMPFDDLGLGHAFADVGHLDRPQAHLRPPSP